MTAEKNENDLGPPRVEKGSRNDHPIRRFLKTLGPGLITGASDDDPSGIGTYSVAGASLGFSLLWTALITIPLMSAVQFICARIGKVSGQGLATLVRKQYPKPFLYVVVFSLGIANTINAGVDLGAIGAAIGLFIHVPVALLIIPVAGVILGFQILGSYHLIERIFKWLSLALFAYIGAAFFAKPDLHAVLRDTFIPDLHFTKPHLQTLVAILGTTISPYLFFWQANQEVEMDIAGGKRKLEDRKGATDQELRNTFWDVNIGMFFSNLVMYFIILATAATLHAAGKTDIETASDAALALKPLAGEWAELLFAFGMIGAGFLAVPVLTSSAGYAIAEAFRWRHGLDAKPGKAKEFYAAIALSTILGVLINFTPINPIKALYWTAIINGFLAPPLLVIIMLIANNGTIMGTRRNGLLTNILGWLTTAVMFAAAIGMLVY